MAKLQTVVETKAFAADAGRLLTDEELTALINWLAAKPMAGDVMEGTGGARKAPMGRAGARQERRRSDHHLLRR